MPPLPPPPPPSDSTETSQLAIPGLSGPPAGFAAKPMVKMDLRQSIAEAGEKHEQAARAAAKARQIAARQESAAVYRGTSGSDGSDSEGDDWLAARRVAKAGGSQTALPVKADRIVGTSFAAGATIPPANAQHLANATAAEEVVKHPAVASPQPEGHSTDTGTSSASAECGTGMGVGTDTSDLPGTRRIFVSTADLLTDEERARDIHEYMQVSSTECFDLLS